MSLINDALNKVEQDRAAQRLAAYPGAPTGRGAKRRPPGKKGASRLLVLNATALAVLSAVVIVVFLRDRSPRSVEAAPPLASTPPASPAVTPASTATPSSTSATDVAHTSPFTSPPLASPASEPAPSNDYELAGMSALGDNTLISITRRSDRRSVWIPIGKSAGEITAISYNTLADEAVIRVHGQLFTIAMRSSSAEASEPASSPAEQAAE